jgi:outer membrane protein assembly factor BamE (lipoprotein component of BamABCDE complex)
MDDNAEQPSSRPRFSLMLLLLVVALCAAILAWWQVGQQPAQTRQWNAHLVEPGMTRDEVNQIMGIPHRSDFERWSYKTSHDDKRQVWVTAEVLFEDGRVKEVREGRERYSYHERTRD